MEDEDVPVVRALAFELYLIRVVDGVAVSRSGALVLDNSLVWIQGVVVDASPDGVIVVDDGTDTIVCLSKSGGLDVVHRGGIKDELRVGNYVAVKGELQLHSVPTPGAPQRLELRNCGFAVIFDANMETLWCLEQSRIA